MAVATWVKDLLQQRGVAYEERQHPEYFTAQEVAHGEHISGHRLAKVVAVIADGRPVELILPASRHVVLDRVRKALGCREIRLATEGEVVRYFPDTEPGAIPALRHWEGVEVLMDDAMRVEGEILLQGGTHRDAVRLRFDDWLRAVEPKVASFSELE